MASFRRAWPVSALLFSVLTPVTPLPTLVAPAAAQAQTQAEPAQLWSDFAHYVLIARPQLAADAGEALLGVDPGVLLDTVEASRHSSTGNLFDRASGMDGVRGVAAQLRSKLESARLDRSRDPERIQKNIDLLDDGQRAYVNATRRLKAAGQYAAPQLLATLRDDNLSGLNPYVVRAMVEVGQPMVAPLSAALPDLEPTPQRQVSQVLAEIGYPYALASLQRVIENGDTDATVRMHAQRAFDQIAEETRLAPGQSAADLYLAVGVNAYEAGTDGGEPVGFDASKGQGLLWRFGRDIGLVPLEVPASVYADALARDAATTALSLNPELDAALSLFLAADLRAENNLGDSEMDPSRPSAWQPASYYALLAGPARLRDVLDTAITDADAPLALDAIDALSKTASIEALQPLVRALDYPDARVRFRAAEALARAMPEIGFDSDFRVVPVLAEAVRQTGEQTALVLGEDQATRNALADAVTSMGYTPIAAASLGDAAEPVRTAPGIDLIVVDGSADRVAAVVDQTAQDYKLAATPVVGRVSGPDQTALSVRYADNDRVTNYVGEATAQDLEAAASAAIERFSGDPIGAEEAEAKALAALALLKAIAAEPSVYDARDALPAMVAALGDGRDAVATAAADAVAQLDSPEAQAALAASALEALGDVQIAQLNALGVSANRFGNLISAEAGDALLELVRSSEGDLALAAAQAHGALSLPTSHAVELILEGR